MIKQILTIAIIISLSLTVNAQNKYILKANQAFQNGTFGQLASDESNYYVVISPVGALIKIDHLDTVSIVTTLSANPIHTMIWNNGKGIYAVTDGEPFKLYNGSTTIDIRDGQLPLAGNTSDKVIASDYFHIGNTTYFRTTDKIYKTDFSTASSIQTIAVRSSTTGMGIFEMHQTDQSIFYREVVPSSITPLKLKRIDLMTGKITTLDSFASGNADYGVFYDSDYYYCTPYNVDSSGVSSIIKVSGDGTKTVLYTENSADKQIVKIVGVTPSSVIAIMETKRFGKEFISISGGNITTLNFNTTANSRPYGGVLEGSRSTNTLVYFVSLDTLNSVNSANKALWVTDGTLAGTKKVFGGTPSTFAANLSEQNLAGASSAEHCNNDLYFNGKKGSNNERLIFVNGNNYEVTSYPIGTGVSSTPSFRKTSSGILFIAAISPDSSTETGVYKINCSKFGSIEAAVSNQLTFDLYPNPSNGQISIQLAENMDGYALTVYNSLGAMVYDETLNQSSSSIQLNLNAGLYYVSLSKDHQKVTRKVIVE